jgi:hypothetical protein
VPATLKELSAEFGVSIERVCQLEARDTAFAGICSADGIKTHKMLAKRQRRCCYYYIAM